MADLKKTLETIDNLNTSNILNKFQNSVESFTSQMKLPEILPIRHWHSGESAFIALKEAVNELASSAPKDHDVLIQAFNIAVTEVRYIEPHTLLFRGFDNHGNNTSVVAHYSQLVAHIVYLPKQSKERVITGFARVKENKDTS